jgi:hypothetical protein
VLVDGLITAIIRGMLVVLVLAWRQPLGRGNPAGVLPVFLGCEVVDQSKVKRGIINRAAFKKSALD